MRSGAPDTAFLDVDMDFYDPRWGDNRDGRASIERDWGSRASRNGDALRDSSGADPFTSYLDLPRGQERELAVDRERVYELSGRESRTLATVGTFRVVDVGDLRARDGDKESRRPEPDIRHLKESGLVETVPLDSCGREAVVLTKAGRDLLEAHRLERGLEPRQAFYAGLRKPRELAHDSQVYRAYARADSRLREGGSRVRRVVLDYELKREYQRFLHERNRGDGNSDGRPDRNEHEIRAWAREHELPYFDDSVHFPDARIEFEDRDGRLRHEDIEVVTGHYRGAHAAATARTGFTCYRSGLSGGGGGRGGRGRPVDPRLAEFLL
jgi:hypothetical protein